MEEVGGYYVGRPKNWRDYYEIAEQQCAEIIGARRILINWILIMDISGKQFVA